MKKILLFPYHPDVEILVKRADALIDISIVGVYSFQEDETVPKALNSKLGCTGSFEEMLKRCDILLLLDNYRKYRTDKYNEVIISAIKAGKQLVFTPMAEKELDVEAYKGKYAILKNIKEFDVLALKMDKNTMDIRHTIETPIIVIFGMGKHCSKFENQILFHSALEKEGYASFWISSNPLGALFGGCTMPDFLYDSHLAFEKKVIQFNHFVYQISVNKSPDAIVIGVPEGISEFTVQEYNHFAEYPLVIGSAVPVDGAVLCMYFVPELDVRGVENVKRHCKERFGFPIHMASVGRTAFEHVEGDKHITYLFLEEEYLKKHYRKTVNQPESYVGIWETNQTKTAIEKVMDRLAGNPDAL